MTAATQNSPPLLTVVFGAGDGGRTWTESVPLQLPAPASLLSFAGADDGWLLANYGGTMGQDPVWPYRTADAGLRWSLIAAAPPSGTGRNGLSVDCDKAVLTFAAAQVGWLSSAWGLPGAGRRHARGAARHGRNHRLRAHVDVLHASPGGRLISPARPPVRAPSAPLPPLDQGDGTLILGAIT